MYLNKRVCLSDRLLGTSKKGIEQDYRFKLKYVFYKIHKRFKINYAQYAAQLGEVAILTESELAKMHKIVYYLTQKNQGFWRLALVDMCDLL